MGNLWYTCNYQKIWLTVRHPESLSWNQHHKQLLNFIFPKGNDTTFNSHPELPLLLIIMFCSSSMSQSESGYIHTTVFCLLFGRHFCNNHHQLKQLHFASFKSSQGPEARSHHSNGSIERLFLSPTASFDYSHTLRSQKEQISKPQKIRTNWGLQFLKPKPFRVPPSFFHSLVSHRHTNNIKALDRSLSPCKLSTVYLCVCVDDRKGRDEHCSA